MIYIVGEDPILSRYHITTTSIIADNVILKYPRRIDISRLIPGMFYDFRVQPFRYVNRIVIYLHIRLYSSGNHKYTCFIILTDVVTDNSSRGVRSIDEQHKASFIIVAVVVLHDTVYCININVESCSISISFQHMRIECFVILDYTITSTGTPDSCRAIKSPVFPIGATAIRHIMFYQGTVTTIGKDSVRINVLHRVFTYSDSRTGFIIFGKNMIPYNNTRTSYILNSVTLNQYIPIFISTGQTVHIYSNPPKLMRMKIICITE